MTNQLIYVDDKLLDLLERYEEVEGKSVDDGERITLALMIAGMLKEKIDV